MSVRFVCAGVHGEVSALPDHIHALIPENGVNGIGFIDFTFDSPGSSTHGVLGLHVGASTVQARTQLSFSGDDGIQDVTTDAFVLRGPGQIGHTRWFGTYRGRFLSMTPHAIERITQTPITGIQVTPTVCQLSQRQRVFHLLAALGQDQSDGGPYDPLYVESVALAVIRASGILPTEPSRRSPALTQHQAERVRDLIVHELATPLSLRRLAEAVGLSESYFVRAFKGSFGITPYQYVLRERVALAQSLIRTGAVSLNEAASRAGFPDARRMGRTFRQVVGRSPTGARQPRKG